jgi:hypothetical protein
LIAYYAAPLKPSGAGKALWKLTFPICSACDADGLKTDLHLGGEDRDEPTRSSQIADGQAQNRWQ